MTNAALTFTYERKKPGDPIRSRDWNSAMQAIADLERALRNKTNGIPTGPLTIQGALNVQGAFTASTVAATTVTATKFVGDGSGLTNLPTTGPTLATAPTNPQRVGQWTAQQGPVNGVYVAGQYAYLAVDNIGLAIVDISDPATPRQVGEGGYASLYTRRVQVAGRYAYLASSQMGLDIFDIANVAIPRQVGAVNLQAAVRDLYIAGPYAYVATSDKGVQIIDITNPAAPQSMGEGAPAIGSAQGIYVVGAYAYVATSDKGLQILNISDPTNPQVIGGGVSTVGAAQGVYVAGQYAYVASSDQGLQIVDISDPAAPQQIGEGATGIGSAQGIAVAGDYAYVATSDNGLQIVNIAQPVTTEFRSGPTGSGMNAEGTQAWMSASIIQVDEPRKLVSGPSVGNIGSLQAVFVAGGYAYVAGGAAGLQIIDLQGAELFAASIGAVATNVLTVSENATVDNNLYVRSALNVGSGGIKSDGTVTAARFVGDGSGLTGIQGGGGSSPWTAKTDGTGIVYKVGANVTIGASNSGTSLQILNKNQDATGDTLILGRSDGSHVRLGYHADYGWLQSGSGKPLSINPLEGNVGIGITNPSSTLHVGVGKSVRFELGINQKLSLGGNGPFEVDAPNIVGGRFVVTEGGSVGVGVPSPAEKLEVNGTVKANKFVGDGSGLTGIQISGVSQWTNAANGVIAYNGGNIGIGTDGPAEKLEVNGTVKATKFVGDGSGLTGLPATGGSSQWTSAANGIISYSGGNVGIGITSPTSALQVGTGKSVRFELGINQKLSLGGNGPFEVDAPNIVGGRFVVTNAGNVGIGVTGPVEKLEVNGTVKATKFVGDGSGLTGIQTSGGSQWTSAANGVIAYNGGNLEVGNFQGADRFLIFKVAGGNQYRSGVKLWAWQENYGYSLQYDERDQPGNGLHIKTHNKNADGSTVLFVGWNGNVGIGTTQASEKLEVNGTIKATKFVGDGSGLTGTPVAELQRAIDQLRADFNEHIHSYAGLPTTGPHRP